MVTIFCGNLRFDLAKDELRQAFAAHGQVEEVRIIQDPRREGLNRGFGFVEMPNPEEAARAIKALNGADLRGRLLKCNISAKPRPAARGEGR